VVAEHGPHGRRRHQGHGVQPALPGQHAAEDDDALARQHRHDDIERRQHQDQQVREGGQLRQEIEGDHRNVLMWRPYGIALADWMQPAGVSGWG
jgi:hypothetical protein